MNIKRLRIILAASFSGLGLLCSVLGFTGALANRTSSKKYADWLKDIPENTLLRDVSLPGSHDTMALYSIADLAGQCQTFLTLIRQLLLSWRNILRNSLSCLSKKKRIQVVVISLLNKR